MGQVGKPPDFIGGRLPGRLLEASNAILIEAHHLPDVILWDYTPTGNRALDDTELKWATQITSLNYRELRKAADRILKRKEQP